MKTIAMIGDLHCGSVFGICPPAYYEADDERREMQEEAWTAFAKIAADFRGVDYLLVNGDCIEGNAKKDGGAELTTPDRNIQAEMAVKAISQFHARKILMTYGTKYHVSSGDAEDFEYNIASDLGAHIGGRLFFEIEKCVIDARHKVGSSSVPYARATGISKEICWDMIKEANNTGPHVDLVVRSHVHYSTYVEIGDRMAMSLPCLQLARGRFGSRECTGEIHWGAVSLTIKSGEIVNREKRICKLKSNVPTLIHLK
jgi:hypothetical protein